jgi:hypothetical protein
MKAGGIRKIASASAYIVADFALGAMTWRASERQVATSSGVRPLRPRPCAIVRRPLLSMAANPPRRVSSMRAHSFPTRRSPISTIR